jgi:hypothetical protein
MGICYSESYTHIPIREQTRIEKILTEHERLLPFASIPGKKVDMILRKYSIRGKLSRQELTSAFTEMGLKLSKHIEDPTGECYRFFSEIKDGFLYDATKIGLCGILISTGTQQEKAQLLFEHYDSLHEKLLNARTVKGMFKEIISMSVEYLPLLSLGDTPQHLDEEELEEFQDMCMFHRNKLINRLMTMLLGDRQDIYLVEFEKKMSLDTTLSQLLWSSCTRSLLIQESKYDPSNIS